MIENDSLQNSMKPNYVLVGDTGEKDEEAGERIIAKHGNCIQAVFLHSVSEVSDRTRHFIPNDRVFRGVPIYYFRTYVGAAAKACKIGLINTDGLLRVIDEAEREITLKENTKFKPTIILKGSYPFNANLKASRRLELENDILFALRLNKIARKTSTALDFKSTVPVGVFASMKSFLTRR